MVWSYATYCIEQNSTFNFKHSFKNKKIISDYEHLDPFRGEETYIPLTKFLRNKIGEYARD